MILILQVMGNILFKVHESYRWVVAVCDKDVFGRKLIDGKRVLDVGGAFFDGKEMRDEEVEAEIARCVDEDATFNFVGKERVGLAKIMGIVKDEGVIDIDGVPVALILM